MSALSLRISQELEKRLDLEAREAGVPRSEVARTAIESYLDRAERKRFLEGFIAEAHSTYGDAASREELLSIAEEALPVDDEALALVEPASARRAPVAATRRKRKS